MALGLTNLTFAQVRFRDPTILSGLVVRWLPWRVVVVSFAVVIVAAIVRVVAVLRFVGRDRK